MKNIVRETEILLPDVEDMGAWAVIACDQYTSNPEYWKTLEKTVGDKPSALNVVLPEIYLDGTESERITKINANIDKYLSDGTLKALKKGMILTVRSTPFVKRRIGIICAVDLEEYDYSPAAKLPIRATEGTIEERIPPRIKIRENASAEFPHIMMLIDDEKRAVIEKVYEKRGKLEKLYDFDLNMGGGHIEGYFIKNCLPIKRGIAGLLNKKRLTAKYGTDDKFLIAVGDGNHSLATAKVLWNRVKENLSAKERKNYPARFALCEIVNVYDEGIYFLPIHRLVKGVDVTAFLKGLVEIDGGKTKVIAGNDEYIREGKNSLPDGIRAVDGYIKEYIRVHGGEVDYVHGDDELKQHVVTDDKAVGIMFDKMDKSELFRYVSASGALPRKTFSMGESVEKRYYLEGRKIK